MVAVESGIGPVFTTWPEVAGPVRCEALACEVLAAKDARNHYIERLGVATDLDMQAGPGSLAEGIARREAARVAAELPADYWPEAGGTAVIDAALSAFGGLGLRFAGFLEEAPPRPEPPSQIVPENDLECPDMGAVNGAAGS